MCPEIWPDQLCPQHQPPEVPFGRASARTSIEFVAQAWSARPAADGTAFHILTAKFVTLRRWLGIVTAMSRRRSRRRRLLPLKERGSRWQVLSSRSSQDHSLVPPVGCVFHGEGG
jgi:hypothetical protein